jgi:starch synthase
MQVLSVASEVFPLIKTGGLADVAGALPAALRQHGVSARTLLPAYPGVAEQVRKRKVVAGFDHLFGGKATVIAGQAAGLDLLLLDAPHLYDRKGGAYGDATGNDWDDNWKRFAALGKAAAEIAAGAVKDYLPDLVHAHDWQAAMAPAYIRFTGKRPVPTVMTVHNLAFQGQFPMSVFAGLGLPGAALSLDGVEYYGGVGFLKAGLQLADAITTVSPTYALEIRTPEFGMGLDGLVRVRDNVLHGIVNGIDTDVWDPQTDPHLAANYSVKTLGGRAKNRRAIEERFGLVRSEEPVFCVVSRLTWQKGMDVLASVVDDLVAMGARIAILGSGDHSLEGALLSAAARHPGRIGVVIGYNEPLSHLMQAGSDAILVPSRFEPCGLTQLYALRYGCIPVVARTGGLADTVIDANEAALSAGVATGVQFSPVDADSLRLAVRRTVSLHRDRKTWTAMQKQGMKSDVSWTRSAARYADLYRSLVPAG